MFASSSSRNSHARRAAAAGKVRKRAEPNASPHSSGSRAWARDRPPCGDRRRALKLPELKGPERRVSPSALRRALACLLALGPAVAPAATGTLTVLTATQRREVATLVRPTVEMVAIYYVVAGLGATLTSDAKGGAATLQRGAHESVLYQGKSLASVGGDLRLLSAPALYEDGRWLLPIDAVPRLLGPLLGQPAEWRAGSRVLLIGRAGVARVSVSTFVSGDVVRVVLESSEKVPFRVQQAEGRVTIAVLRDTIDTTSTRSA